MICNNIWDSRDWRMEIEKTRWWAPQSEMTRKKNIIEKTFPYTENILIIFQILLQLCEIWPIRQIFEVDGIQEMAPRVRAPTPSLAILMGPDMSRGSHISSERTRDIRTISHALNMSSWELLYWMLGYTERGGGGADEFLPIIRNNGTGDNSVRISSACRSNRSSWDQNI